MAESDWDETIGALSDSTQAAPVEHVLWQLQKTGRIARAVVRPHPHGSELRFYVDGELLWSEVFRDGRGVVLGEVAEAKRVEFLSLGWEEPA